MLRFIVFIVVCLLSNSANAARSAEVITDGAMVYEKADFDSTVVGYLQRGQKVRVSNRPKGAFYRVQFSQGVIGYISDVDVKVEGGKSSEQASEDDNKSRKRKKDRNKKKDPEPNEINKKKIILGMKIVPKAHLSVLGLLCPIYFRTVKQNKITNISL